MNIVQKMLTKNDCYKAKKKLVPSGIVVHSTACNQTDANVFINKWNKPDVNKCVHAFVDASGVYQALPFDVKCWGCGSGINGSFNNSHIQFEIAEDNLSSKEYFDKVYLIAIEFCAYLCKTYNIKVDSIVCHSEAHTLGYASNHSDIMHWFPKFGKSMDTFRRDVKVKLDELNKPVAVKKPAIKKVIKAAVKKVVPKKVGYIKILATSLNTRKAPSWRDSDVCGSVHKNEVYTIAMKYNEDFYLLKSGLYITTATKYVKYYEK